MSAQSTMTKTVTCCSTCGQTQNPIEHDELCVQNGVVILTKMRLQSKQVRADPNFECVAPPEPEPEPEPVETLILY